MNIVVELLSLMFSLIKIEKDVEYLHRVNFSANNLFSSLNFILHPRIHFN